MLVHVASTRLTIKACAGGAVKSSSPNGGLITRDGRRCLVGESTAISWCQSTFNPIRGCVEVSPGCLHCYARELSKRNPAVLGVWGSERTGGTRVLASEAMWKAPLKWKPSMIFSASLSDVFEPWQGPIISSKGHCLAVWPDGSLVTVRGAIEHISDLPFVPGGAKAHWMTMDDVRQRLFDLIDATRQHRWLLLTKRPERIAPAINRIRLDGGTTGRVRELDDVPAHISVYYRSNLWLGTSVENQAMADRRIGHLVNGPRFGPVRFLSMEPLLGPVDLRQVWEPYGDPTDHDHGHLVRNYTTGFRAHKCGGWTNPNAKVDWVIVGCESGANARPMRDDWARSLRDQCAEAGIPFFLKQMVVDGRVTTTVNAFPVDLQIQQFPEVANVV